MIEQGKAFLLWTMFPASEVISKHLKGQLGPRMSDVTFLDQWRSVGTLRQQHNVFGSRWFHGFWLVSMVFQSGFMVFHGFWLVSMVFQGGFMVFHGFWLVSMVFQGFQVDFHCH